MTSNSREDRQLMRQRGAGTRNINNVDFGLSLNAIPQNSREERQRMRQRGAGTRKINNMDFGIAFPTSTRNRRSSTKTPQPEQSSRGPSKTPSRAKRGSSAPRSIRGSSASNLRNSTRRRDMYEVPDEEIEPGPSTIKRRKRNSDVAGRGSFTADNTDAELPWTLTSPRRTTSAVAIAEQPEEETDLTAENPTVPMRPSPELDSEFNPQHEGDKENIAPATGKVQKRKKRKSIGQQSNRRKKRSSGNSILGPVQPDLVEVQHSPVPNISDDVDQDFVRDDADQSVSEPRRQADLQAGAERSPSSKKKRRKRKSIVLGRKKRRSSGEITRRESEQIQLLTPDDSGERRQIRSSPNIEDQAEAKSPPLDVRSRIRRHRATRRRRTSPLSEGDHLSPTRIVPEGDENGDETYVDDGTPEPPTPAITKKSRKRRGDNEILPSMEQDHGNASRKHSKRSDNAPQTRPTFPILTHRLTNTGALPTIAEEFETQLDSDDDLNSASSRFPDRAAPNALDVLAQICRETLNTTISKMAASSNTADGRAGVKRKRTALEAFGKELDGRLFEMSGAVENRLTLEGRVKKSKREKAELEARWIEVRRQREEIALKCDAARRKHWESEADGKERHELSENLHNLEMELEKGGNNAEDGLEFMLQSVAGHVSGADGAGLLDRVKDFNRQLERTVAVLEGRLWKG